MEISIMQLEMKGLAMRQVVRGIKVPSLSSQFTSEAWEGLELARNQHGRTKVISEPMKWTTFKGRREKRNRRERISEIRGQNSVERAVSEPGLLSTTSRIGVWLDQGIEGEKWKNK